VVKNIHQFLSEQVVCNVFSFASSAVHHLVCHVIYISPLKLDCFVRILVTENETLWNKTVFRALLEVRNDTLCRGLHMILCSDD